MVIAIDINEVIRDYLRSFIKQYNKVIDPSFEIEYDEIADFDLTTSFPFLDEEGNFDNAAFNSFKYEDLAYEIYGRADIMERDIPSTLNRWVNSKLRELNTEVEPEVILFSPFEINLTIPSTLSFLSRYGIKIRSIEFPIDSSKIWDKADIVITANPNLLELTPEGKYSFKVNAPYNKGVKGSFEFDGIIEIIKDEDKTIEKIIENNGVLPS